MRQINRFTALLSAWLVLSTLAPALLRAADEVPLEQPALAHLALPSYIESQPLLPRSEPVATRSEKRLWWISLAAVAGATAFDAFSSWNRTELNPVLRSPNGQFGSRGALIKVGLAGAFAVMEGVALRHEPKLHRSLAITNFAIAGGYATLATRNMTLSR